MSEQQQSSVKVYSRRLQQVVEVPLEAQNPREEQLGGVMPVMLVTDHPLAEKRSLLRVYSKRLNREVEVPLEAQNPREEQLGGVMPVMLVTDHPLAEK